jgi:hypothetical protein
MIPSGHTWFIIETSSAVEESMIEQALRNRANFKLTDLGWMVDKVRRMVKGE